MKTVLHIAAHMGGGVGKVLSNVAISKDSTYKHQIVLLEKPIDTVFTDKLDKETLYVTPPDLLDMVAEADIVQLDWWNHPLLAKVMHNIRDIPMRSIVWSHTAGCYYPYIKPDFMTMPDHFIASTKYSLYNPHWMFNAAFLMDRVSVINSSGGFTDTQDKPLAFHDGFNVGYVGTLGYVKLLPQFIEYCKVISNIPGIRFVMIGRIPEPNLVLRDAENAGIANKFVFKGYVSDLPKELAQLDVLGYLLNSQHFGTTENAMLEAMSMGIPPVCIDQCSEKYLVEGGLTGYLVKNKDEYAAVMQSLYNDKTRRKVIGINARNHVLGHMNLNTTISKLDGVYDKVMQHKKRIVPFARVFGGTPYDWYLSGCPPSTTGFSRYLTDSTKGSVTQWHKYFPEDTLLAALVR